MHLVYPQKCCKTLVFDFSWNDLACGQRFLSCMALNVYEVIRMACLSHSWFVYSQGVKRETSASRVGMTVISRRNWKQWLHVRKIDFFYRYGGHIEFIRFKEYYGMPRGHLLSIYTHFSAKKRTSMYISDRYYIQRRHNDLFSHYNFFLEKLKEKLTRKARVNTDASI